ncbi:hypothetical protein KCV03_g286, partial [Aureobasidium melanogenum]
MVGDPDAVKMDVMLLALVAVTELLVLVEVVIGVVRLDEIVEAGVLVLETALLVAVCVLSELVSEAMLVSDAEESALFAVEDVEADRDDG